WGNDVHDTAHHERLAFMSPENARRECPYGVECRRLRRRNVGESAEAGCREVLRGHAPFAISTCRTGPARGSHTAAQKGACTNAGQNRDAADQHETSGFNPGHRPTDPESGT